MQDDSRNLHTFELDLLCEYFAAITRQGPGSPEVTERALGFVEGLSENSRIADLGCGTGGQTGELAARTPGRITGIDLFPAFIDRFNENMAARGVRDRVSGVVGSMDDLPFGAQSLDLIWSEGAIYNIGFERGIREWKRFLKPGGFLAVSDATWLTQFRPAEIEAFWNRAYPGIDTTSNRIRLIEQAGYTPMASFVLPESCWTEGFYVPQEEAQQRFLERHVGNPTAMELVENQRHEADLYCRYKAFYGYVFYILKRC